MATVRSTEIQVLDSIWIKKKTLNAIKYTFVSIIRTTKKITVNQQNRGEISKTEANLESRKDWYMRDWSMALSTFIQSVYRLAISKTLRYIYLSNSKTHRKTRFNII